MNFEEAVQRQSEAAQAYLTGRGISLETAIAHNVGFDPAADPAGAPAAAADAYKAHHLCHASLYRQHRRIMLGVALTRTRPAAMQR